MGEAEGSRWHQKWWGIDKNGKNGKMLVILRG
jgi:hypothetical protein